MTAWNPRRSLPSALILAALAFAGVFAAGCGGGSGNSGSTVTLRASGSTSSQAQTTAGAAPAQSVSTAATTLATSATPDASGGSHSMIGAANAVCAQRNRELAAAPDASVDLHVLATAARKRAAVEQRALEELEKLTPPAGLAARYHKLILFEQAALLQIVKLGERAKAGDTAGVRAAKAEAGGSRLRLLALTARTGLRNCSAIG